MRTTVITAAVAGALVLGAAPAVVAAGRTTTIAIADLDFSKRAVTIKRGDSVRWVWKDGTTPHDVKSKGSPRFRSSSTKSTGTHTVRFTRAGTYRYVCTIHLNMRGKVVVR